MSTKKVLASDTESIAKYKVLYSEKYGRHLVAGEKINAGEIIIREKPVVVGAAMVNDNLLCFECLRIIPTRLFISDSNILCTNCQAAIFCCVACKARNSYHTIEECEILKNITIPLRPKNILLPLRLLLLKRKDEELWGKILRLESHLEARRNTDVWKYHERHVINGLKSLMKIDKSEENDFSDLLQKICGILEVNSFGIPSSESLDTSDTSLRGLYLEASLITHDCRGNSFCTIDDKYVMTVYARKPIDDGEMILINYTLPLSGMAERRKTLREGKFFECDCPLCEDPQELGTNLSTIFCPYCNDGLITFASRQTKDPYTKEKNWKCNKCQISLSGYLIAFYLYLVKMRIKPIENSIEELEVLLKKLSSIFHPNHFLMLDIKRILLELHENETEASNQSKKKLKRMIEIATDVLKIREIVEPGISFSKGALLHSIHMMKFHLTNRDFLKQKMAPEEFMKTLETTVQQLEQSLSMLQYAPDSKPEGFRAEKVLRDYKLLCQYKDTIIR